MARELNIPNPFGKGKPQQLSIIGVKKINEVLLGCTRALADDARILKRIAC